jgi:hypothetical protein
MPPRRKSARPVRRQSAAQRRQSAARRGKSHLHGGAGSRTSTPVSSPAKASGAQHIEARLQACKQLVSECKAALKKRGFLKLYRLLNERWNDSHSYSGPLCHTAKQHVSGKIDDDVRDIYDELVSDGEDGLPSKADFIKPKGKDRAMLDVLIWANVGAEQLDESNYYS